MNKTVEKIFNVTRYAFCIFIALICLLPFIIVFVNATRSTIQIQNSVSLIPGTSLITNWNILVDKGFDVFGAMANSFFIAASSTVLCVYFSALTAFAFIAYNFKAKNFLFTLILGMIMIPTQLGMIGFYQFMLKINLTDSYIPLIVPGIASATTVFFLKQYLEANYSEEITQAARIDGASEFKIFNLIILPLMSPALATMAIFSMIYSWNNYVMPLILLNDTEMYTLPMLTQLLKTDIYKTEYGSMYLGISLTILPLLLVYFAFSKFIIKGVALGGVKG